MPQQLLGGHTIGALLMPARTEPGAGTGRGDNSTSTCQPRLLARTLMNDGVTLL